MLRTRWRLWLVAISIALLIVIITRLTPDRVFSTRQSPPGEQRSTPTRAAMSASSRTIDRSPAPRSAGNELSGVTVTAATGIDDPASRAQAIAKLDETIQRYRATMVYPLSSRPADDSNKHTTHWNHAISVSQPFAVDAAKREIAATATIDRSFASKGTAVTLELTASYVADGAPASLDQADAQLQWRDRQANEWVTAQVVPLQQADGRWVGAVVPSQVDALRTTLREVRLVAFARVGELSREFALDFAYAVDPPVVIRGIASDRMLDGHLVVELDVDLAAAVPVGLMATLFAADGTTPIAVFDDRYFPTHAGRQTIAVRFFGKILHDRQIDGPYRVGAVHGYAYRQSQSPDQLWFERADAPAMMTQAYAASGFSAADDRSPEAEAQIVRYQDLRAALGGSRTTPAP